MTIWFDMDGTIADLYAVDNWLAMLRAENSLPYEIAAPMVRLSRLARRLNTLRKLGYEVGILSWLSKCGSAEYDEAVTAAKCKWLSKHLPSVTFDKVVIVPYGTPKESYKIEGDIIFDDEARNRENWGDGAYEPEQIFEILCKITAYS